MNGSAHGALAALLAGHVLARTGNVVAVFALPFIVLERGGGAVEVGVAAFAATAPIVLGGPLGGALVDRIGALRCSAIADAVSGVTVGMIPLLAATVGLPLPALLALVFVGGLLDAPGETARQVVLPQLAAAAGIRLERAVGFLDATARLSVMLGGPLAGALVALLGAQPVLIVTAAAFAVSSVVTALLARSRVARIAIRHDPKPSTGTWAELSAGLRFVAREPVLRLIVGMVLVTNLLDAARSSALLPLYAEERLGGPAALGFVVGAFGAAAFAGSLLFGLGAHRVRRRPFYVLGFLLAGGPSLLAPALAADLPWLIAASLVSGLAAGSLNPIIGAVQLERTPAALRGRVLGAVSAGCWAGIPLGGLLGGLGASALGITTVFGVVLALYTLVAVLPLLGRAWRGMERQGEAPR